MPMEVRKVRNRLQIAQAAAAHTSEMETDGATAAPPQEDWMNAFIRFAEDASSERLQDMFSRILAGEVVRPGTFSLSTLRTVSELDQSIAKDFSQVWEKSVGYAVDYSSEFQLGEWFSRWKRLTEAGLMAESAVNQYPPEVLQSFSGPALWSPFLHIPYQVTVFFLHNCRSTWKNIEFTRAGRELGSILATPDYEANIRGAVARLDKEGIVRVDMHGPGQRTEILFAATGWG